MSETTTVPMEYVGGLSLSFGVMEQLRRIAAEEGVEVSVVIGRACYREVIRWDIEEHQADTVPGLGGAMLRARAADAMDHRIDAANEAEQARRVRESF